MSVWPQRPDNKENKDNKKQGSRSGAADSGVTPGAHTQQFFKISATDWSAQKELCLLPRAMGISRAQRLPDLAWICL